MDAVESLGVGKVMGRVTGVTGVLFTFSGEVMSAGES